jgi:hypothetical protein
VGQRQMPIPHARCRSPQLPRKQQRWPPALPSSNRSLNQSPWKQKQRKPPSRSPRATRRRRLSEPHASGQAASLPQQRPPLSSRRSPPPPSTGSRQQTASPPPKPPAVRAWQKQSSHSKGEQGPEPEAAAALQPQHSSPQSPRSPSTPVAAPGAKTLAKGAGRPTPSLAEPQLTLRLPPSKHEKPATCPPPSQSQR